jgi:hypothetical protein
MPYNALRLCEVLKNNEAKRNFFSEFCKTAVVRRATGGRTWCNCGAAAARCTKGSRGEPFVQRQGIVDSGETAFRPPGTAVWFFDKVKY